MAMRSSLRPLLARPIVIQKTPLLQQRRTLSAFGYEQAKALIFTEHGDPSEKLSLHKYSISPAHGDLLTIRFLASPINPADINQIQGVYPSKPAFTTDLSTVAPAAVGGNEGVAEVISVGDKVKGLKRGDWVIMKKPAFGTWRTHAQTTADALLKIDDKSGLTPEQVGTVSVNPTTAYRMLRDFAPLREGDWFIQNGANSGVGRAAIQLAREWGYKSINIIRAREEGEEELKEELKGLGADVVVTDAEIQQKDFKDRLRKWTQGSPIELALNCVGGKQVGTISKYLGAGAHVVTYGAMSRETTPLPAGLQIFKDIHFHGFWVSRWSDANPEEKKRTVEHVLQLYRDGKFKDTPFDVVKWEWETEETPLTKAVAGTLEGFRKGKGIFVFGKT